eukprot:2038018-Rhodomonas_salina.3
MVQLTVWESSLGPAEIADRKSKSVVVPAKSPSIEICPPGTVTVGASLTGVTEMVRKAGSDWRMPSEATTCQIVSPLLFAAKVKRRIPAASMVGCEANRAEPDTVDIWVKVYTIPAVTTRSPSLVSTTAAVGAAPSSSTVTATSPMMVTDSAVVAAVVYTPVPTMAVVTMIAGVVSRIDGETVDPGWAAVVCPAGCVVITPPVMVVSTTPTTVVTPVGASEVMSAAAAEVGMGVVSMTGVVLAVPPCVTPRNAVVVTSAIVPPTLQSSPSHPEKQSQPPVSPLHRPCPLQVTDMLQMLPHPGPYPPQSHAKSVAGHAVVTSGTPLNAAVVD